MTRAVLVLRLFFLMMFGMMPMACANEWPSDADLIATFEKNRAVYEEIADVARTAPFERLWADRMSPSDAMVPGETLAKLRALMNQRDVLVVGRYEEGAVVTISAYTAGLGVSGASFDYVRRDAPVADLVPDLNAAFEASGDKGSFSGARQIDGDWYLELVTD